MTINVDVKKEILDYASKVLQEESDAVSGVRQYLNEDFVESVETILHSKGRLIVTGIGKSAIIGQKIVATLNSTGTPAVFMHAADAIHGDLGIVQPDDVVLCISKSGNTPEIAQLTPFLKKNGNVLIAMVGNTESLLARQARFVLNCTVAREASPNNLAPTCSSTAQLALGDALASTLIMLRGFTSEDFAKLHPGGILGKRLTLKVSDLYKFNDVPMVSPNAPMQQVILEISGKCLGVTAVVENDRVVGAITDGDLRRMLERNPDYTRLTAQEVMTKQPKTVHYSTLAVNALELMKSKNITNLFVVDDNDRYLGVIHIHDIIKEGIY
ncbi:MAG: KpsF/GutQ family sugar-phosphate isomerase [Bacteroidales bacterium]|nr:KpsF/GutQ family sugar-phosphate isomerase [Bacteroidales bacterium]